MDIKNLLLFLILSFVCNKIAAQHHLSGTWEGILIDDSTGIEKDIIINITLPDIKKSHRCGYEETSVKAFVRNEGEEQFSLFQGILSFDCYSINLYSENLFKKNMYEDDSSSYKGFLYSYNENIDYKEGGTPITYTKMQLVLKKEKQYGYWQSGNSSGSSKEITNKTGRIVFKKRKTPKRA